MLLAAENTMYEMGGSEIFILLIVAIVFGLGIYTLVRFRKSKDF
jgi:hypothetical protein